MGTEEVIQGRYLLAKGRSNAHGASPLFGTTIRPLWVYSRRL